MNLRGIIRELGILRASGEQANSRFAQLVDEGLGLISPSTPGSTGGTRKEPESGGLVDPDSQPGPSRLCVNIGQLQEKR